MGESRVRERRTLRGFRRSQSGATAIEFGLLALPFFALLFALIETSVIYFSNANLDSVVADAGRLIRTGQVQSGGMTEAQFKSYVCDRLALVSDCSGEVYVDVRKFSSFGSATPPPLVDGDGNVIETTVFQPGSSRRHRSCSRLLLLGHHKPLLRRTFEPRRGRTSCCRQRRIP